MRFFAHITFALFLLLMSCMLFAEKDSLIYELKIARKNQNTRKTADISKELAEHSYFKDYDYPASLQYSRDALAIYKQFNEPLKIASIYKLMGYALVDSENYANGIAYLDSALSIYHDFDELLPIIQVYTNKGIALSYIGENEESIENFLEAVSLSHELGDSSQLATNMLNLGIMYHYHGDFPNAIESLLDASVIFENIHDSVTVINAWIEIGSVYQAWGKYDIAFDFYEKARNLSHLIDNDRVLISLFDAMGVTSEKQDSLANATKYYQDVLTLSRKIDYKAGISHGLFRLGSISTLQNDFDKAIKYFSESLAIEKQVGAMQSIVVMKHLLAESYLQTGDYSASLDMLQNAHTICIDHDFKKELPQNYLLLYQSYKGMNEADSALFYYEKHVEMRDSIYGEKQEMLMEDLREKYEAEKKEAEIELLNFEKETQEKQIQRQNQLLLVLGFVFVLLIVIALLAYLQWKRKEENRKLQLKLQLFRSQMNPHFIFNALNSIKNFLVNNQKQQAADYLVDFSQLMRQILESSVEDLKTLDQEISLLQNYLNLQQVRFDHSFQYSFDVKTGLDPENIFFPAMLLQPFVENAVEHGVNKGADMISLSIKQNQDRLLIRIHDNGPGFTLLPGKKTGHTSRAMQITRERIKILRKLHNWHVVLKTDSPTGEGKGTLIELTLPCRETNP
jgi:tetratricopeptide (TPR) repeat protein